MRFKDGHLATTPTLGGPLGSTTSPGGSRKPFPQGVSEGLYTRRGEEMKKVLFLMMTIFFTQGLWAKEVCRSVTKINSYKEGQRTEYGMIQQAGCNVDEGEYLKSGQCDVGAYERAYAIIGSHADLYDDGTKVTAHERMYRDKNLAMAGKKQVGLECVSTSHTGSETDGEVIFYLQCCHEEQ